MATNARISLSELGETISDIYQEYADEIVRDIPGVVQSVAQDTQKDLKQRIKSLFKGRGDYAKSIKSKKISSSFSQATYVIYSTSWYSHLLEHGHVVRNKAGGPYGTTKAQPHWAPAEEQANQELEKKLQTKLRG